MKKCVVINTVALTPELIGKNTPNISAFLNNGAMATITPPLPAVTCSVQANYLTGKTPSRHGIVGNGWYFKDESEIKFWRQSNKLVQVDKIWDKARKIYPKFSCANLFWWFNMYSNCDFTITPRPAYPSDGRKIPDIYTYPADIRENIQNDLGQFPLYKFWGPTTSIQSTEWIAKSALWIDQKYNPTLSLIYLPHLDYNLQKYGPHSPKIAKDLRELDRVCGELLNYYQNQDAQIMILSEYGIMPVNKPIHINRILRQADLLRIRLELGKELIDAGASSAFAVSDHQVAHVYVNDLTKLALVKKILKNTVGIDQVLDSDKIKELHLNHHRSGDLVLIAKKNAWFSYYYWLEDDKAADFAKCVDIHKKSGYDPAELFFDPKIKFLKLKILWILLKKKLGFRALLEVIPLDASIVKGSHGRIPENPRQSPVFITGRKNLINKNVIDSTEVFDLILTHLRD